MADLEVYYRQMRERHVEQSHKQQDRQKQRQEVREREEIEGHGESKKALSLQHSTTLLHTLLHTLLVKVLWGLSELHVAQRRWAQASLL